MYYTNQLRGDGFGANYQTMIYAILYAEVYCKCEFVYTKPNLKNTYQEEADEYENIMNLSNCFKSIDDIEDISIVNIINFMDSYNTINSNIHMYMNSDSMKKIRLMFKENKNVDILDSEYFHIAIHIRRPSLHKNIDNIEEHGEGWHKDMSIDQLTICSHRFTSDDYFINIINTIRNTIDNPRKKFHIISEGKIEDFNNFKGEDILFHINEPVKDSYIYMVMSNILVVSRSSFSHAAALLNNNFAFNSNFIL
uniref:Glycosyltransferase n=1 Tax=viral metagenome TaxID=1070528 RepID=A0A6C0ERA8_9ZZZZ